MDEQNDGSVGKHIKSLREKRRVTQRYLAEIAGIDHSALSRIERGGTGGSPKMLLETTVRLAILG